MHLRTSSVVTGSTSMNVFRAWSDSLNCSRLSPKNSFAVTWRKWRRRSDFFCAPAAPFATPTRVLANACAMAACGTTTPSSPISLHHSAQRVGCAMSRRIEFSRSRAETAPNVAPSQRGRPCRRPCSSRRHIVLELTSATSDSAPWFAIARAIAAASFSCDESPVFFWVGGAVMPSRSAIVKCRWSPTDA